MNPSLRSVPRYVLSLGRKAHIQSKRSRTNGGSHYLDCIQGILNGGDGLQAIGVHCLDFDSQPVHTFFALRDALKSRTPSTGKIASFRSAMLKESPEESKRMERRRSLDPFQCLQHRSARATFPQKPAEVTRSVTNKRHSPPGKSREDHLAGFTLRNGTPVPGSTISKYRSASRRW